MNRFRRPSARPPQLRRHLGLGSAGLLAVAIIFSVGWVFESSKNDRIHAAAITQSQDQLAKPHVAGEVVVGYKTSVSDQTKQTHIDHHAGHLKKRSPKLNVDVVTIAPGDESSTLQDLKSSPDVAFAEPNFIREATAVTPPNDPAYAQQWGYKSAAFDTAWNTTTGTGAPIIALLDSGVDMTHPDLAGHIQTGGFDEINQDTDPSDDYGHGTSTMGIIAEIAGNGIGGVGGCWNCKVMPIKVLDSQGHGSVAQVAAGIVYAADHGAKIISSSLGGTSPSTAEANAVAYAVSKGVIFVASACEDQPTNPAQYYPASDPGVIGVGATNETSILEPWSCWGSFVKISAPSTTYTTAMNHGYNPTFSGTSAAAPFVTAAVALLWAAHPTATRDQIITALLSGADTCCTNTAGGRLNVAKSLALLASGPAPKKGDLTGDGVVNVFDLSYLLSKWNTADVKADLNGDGKVTVFDLSVLLANWAP